MSEMQPSNTGTLIEELHEDKNMKAGERREVVTGLPQKGLPCIRSYEIERSACTAVLVFRCVIISIQIS
jgi:hypothetical protein